MSTKDKDIWCMVCWAGAMLISPGHWLVYTTDGRPIVLCGECYAVTLEITQRRTR